MKVAQEVMPTTRERIGSLTDVRSSAVRFADADQVPASLGGDAASPC